MSKDNYEKVDKQVSGQTQDQQPGVEAEMDPAPIYNDENYVGSGKMRGKNALITGGDSGIGRAVAVAFAKEGANVAIAYLSEQEDIDADKTMKLIEGYGGKALKIRIDISEEEHCEQLIDEVVNEFGSLNILVNNAGKQFPQKDISLISADQLRETFDTNFFGLFYMTKAALNHMTRGDAIINTSSITAYNGSTGLLDYSRYERRYHFIHTFDCTKLGGKRNTCQCGCPGSDLDTAYPGDVRCEESETAWSRYARETTWATC